MRHRTPSIRFVNQYYWPDVASTGQHLADLAEHLAEKGWDVSVLCGRGGYTENRELAPLRETRNGVRIRRVRTSSFGRGSALRRILDYLTFYVQALLHLLVGRRRDLVVTLTTPPLIGFAAWITRSLRGQPYGIWSMDLHPDAEVAEGMLDPGSPIERVVEWMNGTSLRNADLVVSLGACMSERLHDKGVGPDRIVQIPVWSSREDIEPVPHEENALVGTLGLEGKFVIMYSGNAGIAHRFQEVYAAMRASSDRPDVTFLFVGGGPRRSEIEAEAAAMGIENFRYVDYFPRDQLRFSLSLGHVHLITLKEEMKGIAVPGKVYGIMAAGRPAVYVGPGGSEVARAIESADAGVVIDPTESPDPSSELIAALVRLREDPDLAAGLGARGHQAFLRRYEKRVVCEQWRETLEDVVRLNR